MDQKFIEWHKMFSQTLVPNIEKKYHAIVDEVMGLLVDLIKNTPKPIIQAYINTEHWFDDIRLLTELTTEDVFFQEQDCDEEFSVPIFDLPYLQLMGIIEGIVDFVNNHRGRIYVATEIIWDTDGKEVDLPAEVTIILPDDFSGDTGISLDQEKDEYIGDYLSNTYGYCHKGYALTPELYY